MCDGHGRGEELKRRGKGKETFEETESLCSFKVPLYSNPLAKQAWHVMADVR
jgi:hypothetical protein